MPPLVSVIIPVYNCPDGLIQTLDSLLEQTSQPGQYEIIVVDNNSTDQTLDIATSYQERFREQIIVAQENDQQTSYAARNKGVEIARGDILCFVDADMTAPPRYISSIIQYFSSPDVYYLSCNIEAYSSLSTLTARYGLACDFPLQDYLTKDHFTVTACLCVRRELFERVGNFDFRLESCGDMEFGQRVYNAGIAQTFAADIILKHPVRTSYRGLIKKQMRIARGNAQLRYFYPERYTKRFWRIAWGYLTHPLPHHIYKRFQLRQIKYNWKDTIVLAFFRIPINAASLFSLLREYRRLSL